MVLTTPHKNPRHLFETFTMSPRIRLKKQSSQANHGIPSSRNTELHHYQAQFQVQQKYCLEGESDPTFLSCPHSSPTAELHISMRKSPRRKTNSMKSQLQLQILCQDNLYGIRIHSPRNGYQVQFKKNFRSHIPTLSHHKILQPCTGETEII